MAVHYEWVMELIDRSDDGSEIIEVNHADTFEAAMKYIADDPDAYDVGIVRDWDNDNTGNHNRSWAYMEGAVLPEYFEDAFGCSVAKVPKRFFKEVEKFYKSGPN